VSVLSLREIEKRLSLPVTDPKSLVITPPPRKSAFSEDAIDLRLGKHFLLPRVPPQRFIDLNETSDAPIHLPVHVPVGKDNYLVVPAHQTVLGATLEFIKLPYDISGLILTKSSIARTFLVIETAPWVHPYYRGCLTLEIANVSNTPVLLRPEQAIGQLILLKVRNARKPRQISGSYVGPTYPELPAKRS
jgi:dCTP deaminase